MHISLVTFALLFGNHPPCYYRSLVRIDNYILAVLNGIVTTATLCNTLIVVYTHLLLHFHTHLLMVNLRP
jgi:hypothetical protein